MKNKFISMIALIVSAVSFFISIAFLIYRISLDMAYTAIIFQLIATGLITFLCFCNVVYLFTTDYTDDDN